MHIIFNRYDFFTESHPKTPLSRSFPGCIRSPRHWFPGLLRCEGFLREFVTPIVKCSRGSEVVSFFTLPVAW